MSKNTFNCMQLNKMREQIESMTKFNQIEILRLVAKGKSQEEISKIKSTTISNIEKTMQNIRRKLNCKTTNQVIKYCTEHGYLS